MSPSGPVYSKKTFLMGFRTSWHLRISVCGLNYVQMCAEEHMSVCVCVHACNNEKRLTQKELFSCVFQTFLLCTKWVCQVDVGWTLFCRMYPHTRLSLHLCEDSALTLIHFPSTSYLPSKRTSSPWNLTTKLWGKVRNGKNVLTLLIKNVFRPSQYHIYRNTHSAWV